MLTGNLKKKNLLRIRNGNVSYYVIYEIIKIKNEKLNLTAMRGFFLCLILFKIKLIRGI